MLKKLNSFLNLKKRTAIQSIIRKSYKPSSLNEHGEKFLKLIEKDGYCISDIEFLLKNGVDIEWFDEISNIKRLLDERQSKDIIDIQNRSKGSYAVDLQEIPDSILKKFENFAKSKFLISLIENYLGLEVFYRGVQVRKDLNDGKNIETRLWHCDGEDSKIIKIIFYLEDVFENDGPFTYISKNNLNKKKKIKFDDNGRLNDKSILNYIEQDDIKKFFGKVGQCIFVDTCNIYHKGELPLNKPRYAIFFCYNSNYPLNPKFCKPLN